MSGASIDFLNFGIHSLVLAALGWLIVRFVVRDALRRSHAAFLAVLFSLIGAFGISFWPFPYVAEKAPLWTEVHQTFESNWRVEVAPSIPEPKASSEVPVAASVWKVDQVIHGARWLYWIVAGGLLLRLLIQSARVQMWAWRLRGLRQHEIDALPEGGPLVRLRVMEGDTTPCAAGWFPPVIALPSSAFGTLSPRQWQWLIGHEAEHLRRNDTAAALIVGVVHALLWWNPFIHLLTEHHARATEEVCDAVALEEDDDSSAYAEFLLNWAAKPALQPACIMPIASSTPARRLKARLVALMEARGVRERLGAVFILASIIGVLALPMLVASLGLTAARAQQPVAVEAGNGELFTRIFKISPQVVSEARVAKEWLQERGVAFPEGASAVTNKVTSQLIVRNTKTQLEKIAAVLADASVVLPQVYATGHIVIANQFYGKHGEVLDPWPFQQITKAVATALKSEAGVEFRNAPSVTMKLGTEAIVEIIREGPAAEPQKFAGTRIALKVQPKDEGQVEASVQTSFGTDNGETLLGITEDTEVDWSRATILESEARAAMVSGQTLVTHVKVGKKFITSLITLKALRPDGQTATGGFSEKTNLLPESAQGPHRIHLTTKVVDVPRAGEGSTDVDLLNEAVSMARFKNVTPFPSGDYLTGIYTDAQFHAIIRALSQKKGVDMSVLPNATVKAGERHTMAIPKGQGGGSLTLTAASNRENSVVELDIESSFNSASGKERKSNLALTLWDGQTAVLTRPLPEDKGSERARLIFITANMVGEK